MDAVIDLHLEGLTQEMALLNEVVSGKSVNRDGRGELTRLLGHVLDSREGRAFVALDGTLYAGYCLVTKKVYPVETPKICGCVNGLYIREAYRKQGLGRKLFQAGIAWLKTEGVSYLELYHMINDPRAATFWNKMGFTPIQYGCARMI